LVSCKCQDRTVSSYPPFTDMPVRHAKLFPIEKKEKKNSIGIWVFPG